jgi:hypothetical protein
MRTRLHPHPIALALLLRACVPDPLYAAEVVPYADDVTGAVFPPALEARIGAAESSVTTATNLAAQAAAAHVSATMETGRVYRAIAARMLESDSGRYSLIMTNGMAYLAVLTNTTSVYVTETSGEGYNGPAVGTVFGPAVLNGDRPGCWTFGYADNYEVWRNDDYDLYAAATWTVEGENYFSGTGRLPVTATPATSGTIGALTLDWLPSTNYYRIVDEPTVISLAEAIRDAHNEDPTAHPTLAPAAPTWQGLTNYTSSVTVTNLYERPVYLYATGTVSVAFSGLRSPAPLYLVLRGPSAVTFPGAHVVGGGSWQTNAANHFIVWSYGTNLFLNPVTASY